MHAKRGVEEVVADKGYHSDEVVRTLAAARVRSYISEPERGARKWEGRPEERGALYANRRQFRGIAGNAFLAMRGQRVERNFAHQFDTGGFPAGDKGRRSSFGTRIHLRSSRVGSMRNALVKSR